MLFLATSQLFRNAKKRLPQELSELVDTGLLDTVPVDPFSGHPIRYDATRQLVWSFGIDEKDDGGDGDLDSETLNIKDFIWRLATGIDQRD